VAAAMDSGVGFAPYAVLRICRDRINGRNTTAHQLHRKSAHAQDRLAVGMKTHAQATRSIGPYDFPRRNRQASANNG
jgi:hypothetical protein